MPTCILGIWLALKECSGLHCWLRWWKCLPTMQETRVQSLGWEDPLEKAMATHSSILVWKIPWTEESGRLQSMGMQIWHLQIGHNWATSLQGSAHFLLLLLHIWWLNPTLWAKGTESHVSVSEQWKSLVSSLYYRWFFKYHCFISHPPT